MLILALAVAVTALLAAAAGAAYGGRHTAQQSHRADLAEDDTAALENVIVRKNKAITGLAAEIRLLRCALRDERAGRKQAGR